MAAAARATQQQQLLQGLINVLPSLIRDVDIGTISTGFDGLKVQRPALLTWRCCQKKGKPYEAMREMWIRPGPR
jgi:hypothetical protein